MTHRPPVRRKQPVKTQSDNHGMYGHRWRKSRAIWIAANPWCVACEAVGVTEMATVVDHIVAHKGNLGLFWDSENWQSLCKRCHDKKTAQERTG